MRALRRAAVLAVLVAALILTGLGSGVGAGVGTASAHPLGSFTVNSASVLRVGTQSILVDVVVDFAEIPAAQVRPDVDALGPRQWQEAECARTAEQATLTLDGRVQPLAGTGGSVTFPAGDGGLSTLRLVCRYSADVGTDVGAEDGGTVGAGGTVGTVGTVEYSLAAYADRIGWRETVALGDGTTLVSSNVPSRSPSELLTRYPDDPLSGGSDVTRATLTVRDGGPPAADPLAVVASGAGGAAVPGAGASGPGTSGAGASGDARPAGDGLAGWLGGLVGRDSFSLGVGLLALLVAVVLGTAHAFAPGHGKTVMAARIVGGSATGRQLAATAGAVTLTHTLGVLVLAVVLSASSGFAPEQIYPWLGLASGILIVGLGVSLLRSRLVTAPYAALAAIPHGGHDHPDHPPGATHEIHSPSEPRKGCGFHARAGRGHDGDQGRHSHSHGQGQGYGQVALLDRTGHGHAHELGRHEQDQDRHGRGRGHSHGGRWHTHPAATGQVGIRSLLAAGLVGGMVPTPSAVIVLLAAVSLGRAWFGVLLVLAYGVGMAATLVGVGFLLDRALTPMLHRVQAVAPRFAVGLGWAPVLSAALVVLVGAAVALHAGGQITV